MNRFHIKPRAFAAVLIWVVLISCFEPDQTFSVFPVTYKTTLTPKVNWLGDYRVFTRSGELKDVLLIKKRFAEDTAFYSQQKKYIYYNRPFDSLVFPDRSNAVRHMGFSSYKYQAAEGGGQIQLTSKDTTSSASYGDVLTRTLTYNMAGVKPEIFSERLVSSTAGNYVFVQRTRQRLLLHRAGDRLSMPYIVYSRHFWYKGIFGFYNVGGNLQNNLNPDFFKYIEEGDTIAISQYEMVLEKSQLK